MIDLAIYPLGVILKVYDMDFAIAEDTNHVIDTIRDLPELTKPEREFGHRSKTFSYRIARLESLAVLRLGLRSS